jgi:hypothetical protein
MSRGVLKCVNLTSRILLKRDICCVYLVDDCSGQTFSVLYNREEKLVFCICKYFEVNSILCTHSIEVLKQEKKFSVSNRYIVDRWRKDINRADMMLVGSICVNTVEQKNR